MSRRTKMGRIPPECLRKLESALKAYAEVVGAADLADATKSAYLLHASSFVQWLQDGSGPCARLRSRDIHCRTVNPIRSDAVAGTWKDPRVAAARRQRTGSKWTGSCIDPSGPPPWLRE